MPNSTLVDLVKIIITNTGTGTLQLGAPVQAFRGVDALTDGETYSYSIQQGANYEVGQGVYSLADTTLTRGVIVSSYGNTAIPLSPNAVVAFPALAGDFQIPGPPGAPGNPGNPGDAGPPGSPGAGINMPVVAKAANYTIAVVDANTYLRFTAAGAVTLTIPTNVTAAIPIASVIAIEQAGTGVVTVAGAGGVTVNCRGGVTATAGQYAVMQLKKVDTDVWTVLGDVA